jgi:hypothetical protein
MVRLWIFLLAFLSSSAFGLDVNGQLINAQLEKKTANPTTNQVEGRIFWDSDDDVARYYTGAAWRTIANTTDALTNPMDAAGQLIYGGASGTATKLAAGTSGQALFSAGTSAPVWTGLLDGKIWMGNASNLPIAVTPSGDVTMSNAGVNAIASGVIVDADINASAAIAGSKLVAATGSVAGAVTTSAQTFAGDKTFTGVILGPVGSAANPTFSFSSDPDTGVYRSGTNQVGVSSGGTVRLSVDGTDVTSTLPYVAPVGSASVPTYTFLGDTNTGVYQAAADNITFATAGSEIAEMDASTFRVQGKIGANSTATSYFHTVLNTFSSANGFGVRVQDTDTSGTATNILSQMDFSADDDATGAYLMEFTDSGGQIGAIKVASATAVSYNTTSDERLKHDFRPITDGIDRVKLMAPSYYRWNENNAEDEGFGAQSLQAVVPRAVSGNPSDDVTINPMSIDYGRVTPVLTAAVKELITRLETLETEFAAYKAAHP